MLLVALVLFSLSTAAQQIDSPVSLVERETVWDQGVPVCPEDEYISSLIEKIDISTVRDSANLSPEVRALCCEIGLAFYSRAEYDAANWYLERSTDLRNRSDTKAYQLESKVSAIREIRFIQAPPITIVKTVTKEPEVSESELAGMKKDIDFLNSIPNSFNNFSKSDMKKLAKQIDQQIKRLMLEKDSLIRANATKEAVDAKEGTITTLKKEKEIIDLNIENSDLTGKNRLLATIKAQYKKYLIWAAVALAIFALAILVLLQSRKIKSKDLEILKQLKDIIKKNTYLEHAAKLIRHDMHSGINTYMPRGISSLEKRITPDEAKQLKIDTSLRMIKEGLNHTQKVYKSVYEFTNLVKQSIVLEKKKVDLKSILAQHIAATSYSSNVVIEDLIELEVNETLFCNAVDNLIRNGLKYNDSDKKEIKIYMQEDCLIVEDNGRGMSLEDFNRNINKIDTDSGIGLNISLAILTEHGFEMTCERLSAGTKIKIKLK